MCSICGCNSSALSTDQQALHPRAPLAQHSHAPGINPLRMLKIEQDLFAQNNAYAAANRQHLTAQGILSINLLSSPGSGKTSLLCRSIEQLLAYTPVSVIEGDQQTSRDADRIRASGANAVQINTGKGCHLDAHGVGHAIAELQPPAASILFIENVGNLVCPAAFDLGESYKVVILSVTEGEDKPLKYPDMFYAADLMLINKIDLLPYVAFDCQQAINYAQQINPRLQPLLVSATSGAGMPQWLDWLQTELSQLAITETKTCA